jgi:hypothetical protein
VNTSGNSIVNRPRPSGPPIYQKQIESCRRPAFWPSAIGRWPRHARRTKKCSEIRFLVARRWIGAINEEAAALDHLFNQSLSSQWH